MSGKYVLKASGTQYMFNLQAANGEKILTSERYTSKDGAKRGIASCQVNSSTESHYERRTSTAKQPYFVLKGANGEVIGTSEMYSSEAARETGIASCKHNGPTSTIDDHA